MKEFSLGLVMGITLTAIVSSIWIQATIEKPKPTFSTPCIHNLAFIYDRGYLTQVIDENGKGVRCV